MKFYMESSGNHILLLALKIVFYHCTINFFAQILNVGERFSQNII